MIDVKELRIGNYLNIHGEPAPIQIGWFYASELGKLPPHEAIPLTPEILENCGFTFSPELTFRGLRLSLKFARWAPDHGLQVDSPFGDTTIKSLHQLQNWFYCLTGWKLEVKL